MHPASPPSSPPSAQDRNFSVERLLPCLRLCRLSNAEGNAMWFLCCGNVTICCDINDGDRLTSSSHMTWKEQWKGMAVRLLFSPAFRLYYVLMIVVNFFALVYTIFYPQQSSRLEWFIALEVFITAMLCMEVALRLVADGTLHFFRSKSNIFDVIVTLLCLGSLVMLVWLPTWAEYIEEDVAFLLRCLRDLLRLLRLCFLIRNHRNMRLAGELQPISLRLHSAELELGNSENDTLIRAFDCEAASPSPSLRFSFSSFPNDEDSFCGGHARSERSDSVISGLAGSMLSPMPSRDRELDLGIMQGGSSLSGSTDASNTLLELCMSSPNSAADQTAKSLQQMPAQSS